MLTHESKTDLTLIQTLGQMLNEVGYQLKLSSEIRTRLIHATRRAWKGSREELELKVDLNVDDAARVIALVDGTQLWSGTMLESHEDVGNEVARLIENVATNYYCSAR